MNYCVVWTAVNSNRTKRNRHLMIITLLVSFSIVIFCLSPLVILIVVMPHLYENISPLKRRTAILNISFGLLSQTDPI